MPKAPVHVAARKGGRQRGVGALSIWIDDTLVAFVRLELVFARRVEEQVVRVFSSRTADRG